MPRGSIGGQIFDPEIGCRDYERGCEAYINGIRIS
jgi:hypothetical protein